MVGEYPANAIVMTGDAGQEQINSLLAKAKKRKVPIHFIGMDLAFIDFSGAELRNSYFERCDVRYANFKKCDLSQVTFDCCKIYGAVSDEEALEEATKMGL